jgi:hypothetical protein|tara:strand:- start:1677 stop:2552 length:876 start_codon:yes stop_codon:yes gene_type:complete
MTQLNTSELDTAIQDLGASLSSIINRALTVDDMRMQALSSVEFQADGDGVYGKGLRWQGTGPTKQLIYRSNPDRIWTDESIDLGNEACYMIGNTPVLRMTELGSAVRNSSLVTVGTLQNLNTNGNLNIDSYIFYNTDTESLGIGTESPNGKFAVATLDAEFIIDTAPGTVKLGTWTSDDLTILTDDTARLVVRSNGNIDLGNPDGNETKVVVHGKLGVGVNQVDSDVSLSTSGPVKFENKKFMNGTEEPTSGIFRQGDIVWNENTISTGYIGWVCTRAGSPGEWKPFGQIG